MEKFFEDMFVGAVISFGASLVAFGLALGWFKAVGRELDRATILLAAKIFGGIFVGSLLLGVAFKLL